MVAVTPAAPAMPLDEGIAAVRLLQATQRERCSARIEHQPAFGTRPQAHRLHGSPPGRSARAPKRESATRETIGSTSEFARHQRWLNVRRRSAVREDRTPRAQTGAGPGSVKPPSGWGAPRLAILSASNTILPSFIAYTANRRPRRRLSVGRHRVGQLQAMAKRTMALTTQSEQRSAQWDSPRGRGSFENDQLPGKRNYSEGFLVRGLPSPLGVRRPRSASSGQW